MIEEGGINYQNLPFITNEALNAADDRHFFWPSKASNWPEDMQTDQLTELLLPTFDRGAAVEIAVRLMQEFGSLPGVLAGSAYRLGRILGPNIDTFKRLKTVQVVAEMMAKERLSDDKPVLSSRPALIDYLHIAMAFKSVEHFRILFLDKKNRLIADELQQTGTVDHTPVYPREVIKRALELSATALILVHNHPSGDPAPSAADVRMTREIADVAKPLNIALHDHIIIGKFGHASLKAMRLV